MACRPSASPPTHALRYSGRMGTPWRNILASALSAAAIALVAAILACTPTATVPAFANGPAGGNATEPTPLVMVVAGFDGGDSGPAVPYDESYDWGATLFGPQGTPAAFYRDMSGGSFTFTPARETSAANVAGNANTADRENDGVVHVTLHREHGAWGAVNADSAVARDFAWSVMEMLAAAGEFIDFGSYDANGDGTLKPQELAICICVAGYEASSVSDFRRTDIPLTWAHSGKLEIIGDHDRKIGGLKFHSYIALAEKHWNEGSALETATQEPLGVAYHELGHTLGLPDLYPTVTTWGAWDAYKVGATSLMDSGGWQYASDDTGWRNAPTALDGWSRFSLGWSRPRIAAKSGDYTVSSQLSDNGYSTLLVPTDDPAQYFIIENRQAEGYDAALSTAYGSGGGIVVWHVDDAMLGAYAKSYRVNDADHRPGVMPLFWETNAWGAYSADWAASSPVTGEPFFDAASWNERMGGGTVLELPLYNAEEDAPSARTGSGISVQFTSDSARDMTVHIERADMPAQSQDPGKSGPLLERMAGLIAGRLDKAK